MAVLTVNPKAPKAQGKSVIDVLSNEMQIIKSIQWQPGERNYLRSPGAIDIEVATISSQLMAGPTGPWTKYTATLIGPDGVVDDNNGYGYAVGVRKGVDPNHANLFVVRETASRTETYGSTTIEAGVTQKLFVYEA